MSKPQGHRNNSDKSHGHSRSGSKANTRRNNNGNSSERSSNGHVNVDAIQDDEFQAHQKDRLMYLIMNSIGAQININTNSGSQLEGTLESIDPNTMKVIIKCENEVVAVNFDDLTDFEISNVDLFNESVVRNIGSFKTDADISLSKNNNARRGENIEKWVPDVSTEGVSLEGLTLEQSGSAAWDQFQTNESKFGITSEFDENLYTTRIKKDGPNYKRNLQKAEQLAKEIESQGHSGNIHLAEERGIVFDDSGIDEEDKYSGVDRSAKTVSKGDALFQSLMNKDAKNATFEAEAKPKYVPPTQRGRLENIDPSIVSATNVAPTKSSKPSTIPSKPPVSASKPQTEKADQPKKLHNLKEINSLKEFSQNFKIPTKIPEDLLPIITKDKQKQEEIAKRSELEARISKSPSLPSSKPHTPQQKPVTIKQDQLPKPSDTPIPKSSQTSVSNTPSAKRAETSKYKLNAKAASFTPSFTPSSSSASPVVSNASTPHFARNSPRLNQPGFRPKRPQASFFSPDRLPSVDKKKKLGNDFNFFKRSREDFDAKKNKEEGVVFRLERPFNTLPTWSEGTVSYKSLFPDPSNVKPPSFPPQVQQFQPIPMLNAPGQFMYPPQPFMPQMRVSPQQAHPGLSPQGMQAMYIQPGMAPGAPMGYPGGYNPRAGGYPGQPMHMMPPASQGRVQSYGKNH
jgi:PAB1-binding protein PBP1